MYSIFLYILLLGQPFIFRVFGINLHETQYDIQLTRSYKKMESNCMKQEDRILWPNLNDLQFTLHTLHSVPVQGGSWSYLITFWLFNMWRIEAQLRSKIFKSANDLLPGLGCEKVTIEDLFLKCILKDFSYDLLIAHGALSESYVIYIYIYIS